jgi:hypothetical protein
MKNLGQAPGKTKTFSMEHRMYAISQIFASHCKKANCITPPIDLARYTPSSLSQAKIKIHFF